MASLPTQRSPALREVEEELAALEHDQWMAWASTLMEREALSAERVARWRTLMVPYSELAEETKEHDRVWARKVLAALSRSREAGGADEANATRPAALLCGHPARYLAPDPKNPSSEDVCLYCFVAKHMKRGAGDGAAGYERKVPEDFLREVEGMAVLTDDGKPRAVSIADVHDIVADLRAAESALAAAQAEVARVAREFVEQCHLNTKLAEERVAAVQRAEAAERAAETAAADAYMVSLPVPERIAYLREQATELRRDAAHADYMGRDGQSAREYADQLDRDADSLEVSHVAR